MAAVLRNMSDAPVYNVIVTCVGISGAGPNAKGEDNGHDYPYRACAGIPPSRNVVCMVSNEWTGHACTNSARGSFH